MYHLPVLALCGFQGAGKSSLLGHLLTHHRGRRWAVITADPDSSDQESLSLEGRQIEVIRLPARLIEWEAGPVRCLLRQDLLDEVERLARRQVFEYLLIETNGFDSPLPIVETFTLREPGGGPLLASARLDGLATVVDVHAFLEGFRSVQTLDELGREGDGRSLAGVLAEQVEFASVLILNKTDLVSPDELRLLKELLRLLNPEARLVYAIQGRVPPEFLLYQFAFEQEASPVPGWLRTARGPPLPATDRYHLHSFVYRSMRPFHSQRLPRLLRRMDWRGVLRSRGLVWLGNRPEEALAWSQVGRVFELTRAGTWWAALPSRSRPVVVPGERVPGAWRPEYSVRRQELAFIVQGDEEARLRTQLDACLMTGAELAPRAFRPSASCRNGGHDLLGHPAPTVRVSQTPELVGA